MFTIVRSDGSRCRSGWNEEEELGVIPVGATGQRSRGTRIIGRAGRWECRATDRKRRKSATIPFFRGDQRYDGGRWWSAREPRAGCRPTGNSSAPWFLNHRFSRFRTGPPVFYSTSRWNDGWKLCQRSFLRGSGSGKGHPRSRGQLVRRVKGSARTLRTLEPRPARVSTDYETISPVNETWPPLFCPRTYKWFLIRLVSKDRILRL